MTDSPFLSDQYCPQQEGLSTSGGSTRKKKKLNELKAFVETKLRSCSEKALEKIGHDDSRRSSISDDQVGMARGNKLAKYDWLLSCWSFLWQWLNGEYILGVDDYIPFDLFILCNFQFLSIHSAQTDTRMYISASDNRF